jgi:hypothetical protein
LEKIYFQKMGQNNSMLREARWAENADKVADEELKKVTTKKPKVKNLLAENEIKIIAQQNALLEKQREEIQQKYDEKLSKYKGDLDKALGQVDDLVDEAGNVLDTPGQVAKNLAQAAGNVVNGATDLVSSPVLYIGVAALAVLILK